MTKFMLSETLLQLVKVDWFISFVITFDDLSHYGFTMVIALNCSFNIECLDLSGSAGE